MTVPTHRRVAVVGAGIQGCCIALELARRGVDVEPFERREAPMLGASRQCEGKLHLGYVYAADRTLGTARLMARGAATFLPALRGWIDADADTLALSEPFHYAVHRDSLFSPDDLATMYGRIQSIIAETIPAGAHPGEEPPALVHRVDLDLGSHAGRRPRRPASSVRSARSCWPRSPRSVNARGGSRT